jgi:hypothetical protein
MNKSEAMTGQHHSLEQYDNQAKPEIFEGTSACVTLSLANVKSSHGCHAEAVKRQRTALQARQRQILQVAWFMLSHVVLMIYRNLFYPKIYVSLVFNCKLD